MKLEEIKILKARKRIVRGRPEVSILFPHTEGWFQRTAILDDRGDVLFVRYDRVSKDERIRAEGI
jgi:hypothetical protein